jgi:hypothetical protein
MICALAHWATSPPLMTSVPAAATTMRRSEQCFNMTTSFVDTAVALFRAACSQEKLSYDAVMLLTMTSGATFGQGLFAETF